MASTSDRSRQFQPPETQARLRVRRGREHVVRLARHLPPHERWLIDEVYVRGLSVHVLARAAGPASAMELRNRQRRFARRLAAIVRRVRQPAFELIALRPELVPAHVRPVARAVLLEGRSLRDAARLHEVSLHKVRAHLQTVRALARIL